LNLNYEKIRAKVEHGGNQWTGYSDLFLVLSVIFLLLYVVTNLRSGAMSIASRSQAQMSHQEAEDLRQQIKAYEVLKDDYVKNGASQDEIAMYQDLMSKLNLLESEAGEKHAQLSQQAREAQEKEQKLNHYQALVKNIINANLVAQSRVKKREQVIDTKEQVIATKNQNIYSLKQNVAQQESVIDRNNQTIHGIESELQNRIKQLRYAYADKKRSKEKLKSEIERLQNESAQRIQTLRAENNQTAAQLQQTQAMVEAKAKEVELKSREAEAKGREVGQLKQSLSAREQQYQESLSELKRGHESALAREKAEFEKGLKQAALSAEGKVAKERAYRAAVEQQVQAYNDKLGKLNAALGDAKKSNEGLQKDLDASIRKQNQQRMLAQGIKDAFGKAGIKADVDLKTGDVTIHFENEYFDTGSSQLKRGMQSQLEKLIPVYAKSLFHDPKIANRISNVEIVGFASPTYQGKYVNPGSLSSQDREAVNYNMDLSYQRAKVIFEHVFDTGKMQFTHQKELLGLAKVSGRSYLATDKIDGRALSNTAGDYCKVYDCKKSQRVIIKINLRDE
jgi:chromosome segregation ATPase